jgi:hypothetical protein
MSCILKDGCPCKNIACERFGKCAECIKYHAENTEAIVCCMREKAKKIYSDTDKNK